MSGGALTLISKPQDAMKKVLIAAVLLLTGYLTQAQDILVDADKKLNTDFSKYKTYTWASQVDNKLDPGIYFLNDLALKKRLRDAVGFAMDGRGYTFTRNAPDLLINFRVFDQPASIKGFTGYGESYFGVGEVRDPEDATTFEVAAGSIIVNVIDMKTGQNVWRGLASGLTNTNGFDRSDNRIRQAVKLMFDQYPVRAVKQ